MGNRSVNYFGNNELKNGETVSYNFHMSAQAGGTPPTLIEAMAFAFQNEKVNFRALMQEAITAYLKDKRPDNDDVTFPLLGFTVRTKMSDPSKFTLITQ